ncbi:MAG: hypothetical protein Kow0037_26760 [Calditrichia bacterium]
MKLSRKLVVLLISLLLLTSQSFSMSFFSGLKKGIGMRHFVGSTRGLGMGNSGLSTTDPYSLNPYNPASWTNVRNSRVELGMRYDIDQLNTASQDFSSSTAAFQYFQMAIPINKNEWAIGMGITPVSLVDFSFKRKITTTSDTYQENVFYKGSISRAHFSVAWRPSARTQLGASFHYYFGTIQDAVERIFSGSQYYSSRYELEYRFYGPSAGFSIQQQLLDSLTVAAFYDFKPSLDFTRVWTDLLSLERKEENSSAALPASWGLGASYSFGDNWTVASNFIFQKWSNGFELADISTDDLDDWYRFGIGFEHGHRERGNSLVQKIDIRGGFSAGKIGYRVNGNTVNEMAVHLGAGIPFFGNRGRLDVALIGGIRGDKSKHTVQEKFYQVHLSISAGELWFQKLR